MNNNNIVNNVVISSDSVAMNKFSMNNVKMNNESCENAISITSTQNFRQHHKCINYKQTFLLCLGARRI